MILLLIGTILVPQILAAARLAYRSPEVIHDSSKLNLIKIKILIFISSIIFCPILSIILHMKQNYFLLKSDANPEDKFLIKKWEKIKYEFYQYMKLELGLETMYQLALQIILLLMAITSTATEDGFKEIFKEGPTQEGEDSIIKDIIITVVKSIGIRHEKYAIILLSLSILFSFKVALLYFDTMPKC